MKRMQKEFGQEMNKKRGWGEKTIDKQGNAVIKSQSCQRTALWARSSAG